MRILFDHQVFSWQTYGGVSRYFAEQMRGLQKLGQEVFLPLYFFSENVYLRELPDFKRNSSSKHSFKGKKILQNILGRSASLGAIRKVAPDVFHPTYFDPYFLKTVQQRGTPFVLTVHDMIHEIYGHGSRSVLSLDAHVVENKRLLAEKADAVIAVSENTRLDLLRFCPEVDPAKVRVIHHGNSLNYKAGSTDASSTPFDFPFLLFVGQRKAYKNFSWMVTQLAALLRTEKDLQLICVGGSDFNPEEQLLLKNLGIAQKVQYKVVGSDPELAALYRRAVCFIFPSQYEGFGIPVLEAFACGCPAVLNRSSSLPEVGGDAAAYFEENVVGSLENAVKRILNEKPFRDTLVEAGLNRVQQFSWEQSVTKHLAVYQSVAK